MKENIKILIVDDEARFLETIGKLLRRRDFEVTTATSGEEALELSNKVEFDVAVVDLKMPGMDGEQVLQKMKECHPDTEVIILTGHGSVDSTIKCTTLGGFSYLYKPCELDTLVHVFNEAYTNRLRKKYQRKIELVEKIASEANPGNALQILEQLISLDKEHGKEVT